MPFTPGTDPIAALAGGELAASDEGLRRGQGIRRTQSTIEEA